MEGLIPLVCKAIKRNKTRSHYKCLSTENAQTYDMDDNFHVLNLDYEANDRVGKFYSPQIETRGGHRRSMSTGYRVNGEDEHDQRLPPNMQLKRFGSQKMFSCVTGAN